MRFRNEVWVETDVLEVLIVVVGLALVSIVNTFLYPSRRSAFARLPEEVRDHQDPPRRNRRARAKPKAGPAPKAAPGPNN